MVFPLLMQLESGVYKAHNEKGYFVNGIKFNLLLCFIFLLSACVPIIEKGEYAIFDSTPGVKIVELGRQEKIKFASTRPIRYIIETELFRIKIYTGRNGRLAEFSTTDNEANELKLKVVNRSQNEIDSACLFVTPDHQNTQVQYLTLQLWNQGCDSYNVGTNSFDVAVMRGDEVLGIKTLIFELKKGGYYVWYDAV